MSKDILSPTEIMFFFDRFGKGNRNRSVSSRASLPFFFLKKGVIAVTISSSAVQGSVVTSLQGGMVREEYYRHWPMENARPARLAEAIAALPWGRRTASKPTARAGGPGVPEPQGDQRAEACLRIECCQDKDGF